MLNARPALRGDVRIVRTPRCNLGGVRTTNCWSTHTAKNMFSKNENNDPFCCPTCGREYLKWDHWKNKQYEEWCIVCNRQKLAEKFSSWTSGNEALDQFIQRTQLESKWSRSYVEWAEPEEFQNISHLADGGFGSIYKATWSKGWRSLNWTEHKGPEKWLFEPVRIPNCEVALKTLNLGKIVSAEFLNKVCKYQHDAATWFVLIIQHFVWRHSYIAVGDVKNPQLELHVFVPLHDIQKPRSTHL